MGLREHRGRWVGLTCVLASVAACLALPGGASAQTVGSPVTPIPTDPGNGSITPFEGVTATANQVTAPAIPQNPFMAPNGRNNIHDDGYMTDTYTFSGPLGGGTTASNLFFRECASVMFDSQGRIVTICVGLDRPVLALLHPQTLAVLAAMQLPVRNVQSGNNPFNDFSGGGYFYLDHQDHAVLGTNDRHVLEVAIVNGPAFSTVRDFNLSQVMAANDGIISVLPDSRGRFWFVTRRGMVGTIDRASGQVRATKLGEGISNSFAVDETGGVFIVSDKALYRFDADGQGAPTITWSIAYPNSGIHKPSQSDAGSGTTPTLMGDGKDEWVAITDNADPMNIQVYRRAAKLEPSTETKPKKRKKKKKKARAAKKKGKTKKKKKRKGRVPAESRQICSEPVFRRGASATDNSLIGTDRALVVENNYGYSGITATMQGAVTEPGLTRVDVIKKTTKPKAKKKKKKKRKKRGLAAKKRKKKKKKSKPATTFECRTVWTSAERAPSVVPKLSLANGLVYTYTKPQRADGRDAWFLTALDFRDGKTVFKRLAGSGFGYNNNYAPVTLAADGTAYVGVLGGIVVFK
jgi:hypothetical protein